jgi:hypothetical protein
MIVFTVGLCNILQNLTMTWTLQEENTEGTYPENSQDFIIDCRHKLWESFIVLPQSERVSVQWILEAVFRWARVATSWRWRFTPG